MTVTELLGDEILQTSAGSAEVAGLQYDSRRVGRGDMFFAFPGERFDGHQFVDDVLKAQAVAIASERRAPQGLEEVWVRVRHGRQALARAALMLHGRPDRRLKLSGVTGTNGKTTTAMLIDAILREAGFVTACIGTIHHKIGSENRVAINTTPESLDLVRYLTALEKQGGTHATLEVSSHALELGRVFGMDFHTVVFTNLSRDHLDFHGSMEAYAGAKKRLFEGAGGAVPRFGVINNDDPFGRALCELDGFEVLTYGLSEECRIRACRVEAGFGGLQFMASTPQGDCRISSRLHGRFNVLNILAAVGTGLSYQIGLGTIARGVEKCAGVPGRFETVEEGQSFLVVVDYAHSDDALENLIRSARELLGTKGRGGRVLTLFGCGGDRDRTKRPAMGEIAGRLSDLVILTSDNPRTENPLNIINDVLVGLKRVETSYVLEPDRAAAIGKALAEARAGDIVLLAGKGHESYQTVGREKIPFDDREVARQVLQTLGYSRSDG